LVLKMMLTPQLLRGLATLVLPLLAAQAALPPGLAATLRASRWQHRLLLVGAPTAGLAAFQTQKKLLATAAAGLAERDFKVLEVPYDQLTPADRQCWTRQLGQPLAGFRVVLIGKDGPYPPPTSSTPLIKCPCAARKCGVASSLQVLRSQHPHGRVEAPKVGQVLGEQVGPGGAGRGQDSRVGELNFPELAVGDGILSFPFRKRKHIGRSQHIDSRCFLRRARKIEAKHFYLADYRNQQLIVSGQNGLNIHLSSRCQNKNIAVE